MSVNYPSSLDNFANPASTDLLDNASPTLDHWTQHSDANDAIEALEAKVGVDGSAVTTSFDYKLSEVTSTDKAVGKTATQTLTNKTLGSGSKVTIGSDADGDMYYRESDGTLTRIPIGTNTYIMTSDGSTPSWQPNAAGSDASTTVKGVVEEATAGELAAGTAIGGTGARLFVNPSTLMPSGKIDRAYLTASFGGTGADGALNITSGTTTIDLLGAAIVTKNYTSISITGTGALAFSNPHASGTIIVLKSQGGVTLTSSANPVIDLRNIGSTGGTAGTAGTSGTASGGAGGASAFGSGSNGGSGGGGANGTAGGAGTSGTAVFTTITGGGGGALSASAATGGSVSYYAGLPTAIVANGLPFAVGTGGGGGGGGNTSLSGAGGRGAGSMYIECAGAFNFTTGTINLAGTAGGNGAASFGAGGGGGGGGELLVLYGSLTANSGTITTTGGSGGSAGGGGGGAGGAGANGGSLVTQNTQFV